MKSEELFFEDLNFFRFFFCGCKKTLLFFTSFFFLFVWDEHDQKKDDFFELVVSKKLS